MKKSEPLDKAFLRERLQPDRIGLSMADYANVWLQAMADLLDTDIPLSPDTRKGLASELRRLSSPAEPPRVQRAKWWRAQAAVFKILKHDLKATGTPSKAAQLKLEELFGSNAATLRKRFQRAAKRGSRPK